MKKTSVIYIIGFLTVLGMIDSAYLTWEHFSNVIPPCSTSIFVDCGAVLRSKYSEILGVPLSLMGMVHYGFFSLSVFLSIKTKKRLYKYFIIVLSTVGLFVSAYLMYLQIVVIGSICLYCTASALISFILFYYVQSVYKEERKRLFVIFSNIIYTKVFKKVLFAFDPERMHDLFTNTGHNMGKYGFVKRLFEYLVKHKDIRLNQKIKGISFENPIGLAAGFDYEAKLTQFLPSIGFGFATVGTVTNMSYKGNPKPRLGRLPRSRSLLVNKGFKSSGAKEVSNRLSELNFKIPVGVSIGRTNSNILKTQKDSIEDIISAFKIFEQKRIKNAYYELNISCPNLIHAGNVSFYPPQNLEDLLVAVDEINLTRPVFVKMPIEKSDRETLSMLRVIEKHSPVGVIFGNLQKDRNHPKLDKDEVKKFKQGYYSGKPTYDRSNELISLTYKNFKNRFLIIGCGGVFNGTDAYEKISRGATLVQLITGLIYEGPMLVQKINFELMDILEKEGYKNVNDAIGSKK